MKTAKKRRLQTAAARARRDAENLAAGGRHRRDVSERKAIAASRLHRPLSGVAEALNAQLQTPEAWAWVWREE
jgi:hypothetical protein